MSKIVWVWKNPVDLDKLKYRIEQGDTAMEAGCVFGVSRPTIMKIVKRDLGKRYLDTIKENGAKAKLDNCRTARLGK